jgi:type I restriction enzyme S subunit
MKKITYNIKDIAIVKNGSTPPTIDSANYDGDIVWITPKDLSDQNSRYIFRGERHITRKGYESCSTTMLPKGTVLLSSRAPIGLLAIAAQECCTNQGFKNLVLNDNVDGKFLYYFLKTKIKEIEKLGSGTTFKEVSKTSLENWQIDIPESIFHQQNIASVLSALDDKIEINNRINDNLPTPVRSLAWGAANRGVG